jgi:hypothetical protein
MTELYYIVHYVPEYTASNNSLYHRDKYAEKCASSFLLLCMYLGNRSTIKAVFVSFKNLAGLENFASDIHPK